MPTKEAQAMELMPFLISLRLAFTVTLILVAASFPLACLLALKKFALKPVVEMFVALPTVLPPTVIGFYMLEALSPRLAFGGALEKIFHMQFVFSFAGIVLGGCIHSLPFMVQPLKNGLQSLDRSQAEMSRVLGKSELETFFRITLPQIRPYIMTGLLMTFVHTMGAFGVVLMVGGNIPGVTKVASIALYEKVETMDFSGANLYAAVLVGISLIAVVAAQRFGAKRGEVK
jgi:molybdate transport system permease protein